MPYRLCAFRNTATIVLFLTVWSSLQAAEIPGAAPETVGMSSQKLDRVNDVFNLFVKQKRLAGGIVMIARKGRIVHFESYGFADLASQRPMGKDAILRFYSMSKAITSAAAMILVDEGKLDLQVPVSTYIPEMNRLKVATKNQVTVPIHTLTTADLLRHTSGMTYGDSTSGTSNLIYHKINP
ncbi:MAG: serine hydrolase domain-containing protein, partial [Planctomycetaceae bacterium]